ncbi:hypothetical protein ASA1KI_13840 [Opitutales bacterium ASA1]|nr:hypothetical protein ASA1KI_13840 [Opitutales bacterium ASA1]
MSPFLLSVPSAGDHWMFVGSNGAITAGRGNTDRALFPYTTQDKLFDNVHSAGSLSLVWLGDGCGDTPSLWEPWANVPPRALSLQVRRSVAKDATGSRVVFEEERACDGLHWTTEWSTAIGLGIVRRAVVENRSDRTVQLRILDGIHNIVPGGLWQAFQDNFSNLADAYKRCELLRPSGIGLYYLGSIPTDRAEPSEGLTATVVWSCGLDASRRLLGGSQVAAFRRGEAVREQTELRGQRGAYLLEADLSLAPGEIREWWICAETAQDAAAVVALRQRLERNPPGPEDFRAAVEKTAGLLRARIGAVDGLQSTADERRCWRHFSNALYNSMRGGLPAQGHVLRRDDLSAHVRRFNRPVWTRHREWLESLPPELPRSQWLAALHERGDPDLVRLGREYLPLTFSRRHGDPSRPWNRFSIETQSPDGRTPRIAYQGNWRDIFQNWEALLHAYPEFADAVVARFLDASTADGNNPYRIHERGFEWEEPEPDQPWSNIGYWGDHQIAYLLKLLEFRAAHAPDALLAALGDETFVHARVPYRIAGYEDMLARPRDTVAYDHAAHDEVAARVRAIGADGQLLHLEDDSLVHAGMAEKLLVPLLAKLSAFVPDGGIWMNTQRPEWNDANNALAGYGLSVVTLGYVHRYVEFLADLLGRAPDGAHYRVAVEVENWIRALDASFAASESALEHGFDSASRRALLDGTGRAGSDYRMRLYEKGLSGDRRPVSAADIVRFLRRVQRFARDTLLRNRREDGLWHSYNILRIEPDGGIAVDRLDEMLEGQVSILASGVLSPAEAAGLASTLPGSRLYRADLGSYMLQPDRALPAFLDRNRIPEAALGRSRLLSGMLDCGDARIVVRDADGCGRFHASLRNAECLRTALATLRADETWADLAAAEADLIEEIYESTFRHRSFTGRSASFFAYEGLGSIYWHMVSKLVLALQENHGRAIEEGAPPQVVDALAAAYHATNDSLGWRKDPARYGAFPTDAYSHTPAHAGAQQPGMTGQVKEDLIVRRGELGVGMCDGRLRFDPRLLRRDEFHDLPTTFSCFDPDGTERIFDLPAGSLAFTVCGVPVVYTLANETGFEVRRADGSRYSADGVELTRADTTTVLERTGAIERIHVFIRSDRLC